MDEMFGNRAWVTPKSLASEAGPSRLSSSSSTSSPTFTKLSNSNRKREVLLEELISQSKIHHAEKNEQEKKKLEIFDKFREERLKMHKEKISMQQKLLDVMTKICSTNENN